MSGGGVLKTTQILRVTLKFAECFFYDSTYSLTSPPRSARGRIVSKQSSASSFLGVRVALDDAPVTDAAVGARGDEAELAVLADQPVGGRRHQSRTGRAKGVADGQRPTVHVELLHGHRTHLGAARVGVGVVGVGVRFRARLGFK